MPSPSASTSADQSLTPSVRRAATRLRRRLRRLSRAIDRVAELVGWHVRNTPPRRDWTRGPRGRGWVTETMPVAEHVWVRHHRRRALGERRGTLVFVHGWGMAARSFNALTDEFIGDHDMVLVDLPGFAGLPHPPEPSMELFAAAVASVCRDLDLGPVTLVGHSTGCHVATEAALHVDLRSLVLLGPPDTRVSVARTAVRFLLTSLHEPRQAKKWALANYLWAGVRWMLEVVPLLLEYDLLETVARLDEPLLVVRGEHDRLCPDDFCDALYEAGGAVCRTVPGAAHSLMIATAPAVAQQMRHAIR